MHERGVVRERVEVVEDRRQRLVLDLDQVDRLARDLERVGGHRGDGLAEVADHVLGEDVLVHDVQPELVVELLRRRARRARRAERSAADVSMLRIRARAYGLFLTAACSMPGSAMSLV